MIQSVVAVVDGTKARFFTLEPAESPQFQSGPNLIERECLTNTTNEMQGKDLWTSTKTGKNRGSGGQAHGYDDHRVGHLNKEERDFARDISTKIADLTSRYQVQQIVLVAEPQILGLLRESLTPQLSKLKLKELAKDLCKLKPLELHEYLAAKELLPPRKTISH